MVTHLNTENFKKTINQGDVVVDFWAPWCGPCQMMGPVFEDLSKEMDNVNFAKLNTDEHPELARSFGIQGIPTLVVLKEGKEVNRIVGFMSKDDLKDRINSILG